jgi:hypothetical protein
MTRATYARELKSWALLAVAVGAIEGGLSAVILKNMFAGVIARTPLNFVMALVSGAGMYANLFSLAWTAINQGRNKVRLIVWMQVAMAVCLVGIALAPLSAPGVALFSACVICGRLLWAGVITIRSAVWRANYPRHVRATLAGGFLIAHALLGGVTALGLASILDRDPGAFRWAYPGAALAALAGALFYRRIRVQQHGTLLASERTESLGTARSLLLGFRDILKTDRAYRFYMLCMFIFGSGNLMIVAPVIAVMSERMALDQGDQILITAAIPLLLAPVGVLAWSRLLNRRHVVAFRAIHAWSFVMGNGLLTAGAITGHVILMWLGAAAFGFAQGGGELGWNLGHNDFVTAGRSTHYMGLHMTLTGLRGLIAPIMGIGIYQLAETRSPGDGRFALLVPLTLSIVGAFAFVLLNRWRRRQAPSPA